jgi:hypothetical protein
VQANPRDVKLSNVKFDLKQTLIMKAATFDTENQQALKSSKNKDTRYL